MTLKDSSTHIVLRCDASGFSKSVRLFRKVFPLLFCLKSMKVVSLPVYLLQNPNYIFFLGKQLSLVNTGYGKEMLEEIDPV